MNEVRVPGSGGYNGNLEGVSACLVPDTFHTYYYEKEDFVDA